MIWRMAVVFGAMLLVISGMMAFVRQKPSNAYLIAYLTEVDAPLNLMWPDGSHKRAIVQNDIEVNWAKWSPDGRWILVSGEEDSVTSLYLMRPNGRERRTLVASVSIGVVNLAWSPDSQQVAFVRYSADQADIYIADVDGGPIRQLTSTADNEQYVWWSPDGDWIYYWVTNNVNVFLARMHLDSGEVQRLTPSGMTPNRPVWSPDGEWAVFTALVLDTGTRLFKMRSDGSELHQLSEEAFDHYLWNWPPENDWFVLDGFGVEEPVLYLIGTDGDNWHTIPTKTEFNYRPQWSTDGEWIIFEMLVDGDYDLFRVRSDGSDLQRLTHSRAGDYGASSSPFIDLPLAGERLLALGGGLLVVGIFGAWMKGRRL